MTQKQQRGKRRKQYRNLATLMIISTEGKTEEEYFKACKGVCKKEYILKIINKKTRSSPLQVVHDLEDEKTTLDDRMKSGALFYAIFDHHKKNPKTGKDVYNEAIELCKKNKFTPITSKPSFEFWLILHFKKTNCPMTADEAEKELNKLYNSDLGKNYKKGSSDTFKNTKEYIQKAKERSEQIWNEEEKEKGSYTNVHKIIQELNL